ncbi:monooxygenase 2-like [Papaver somniferum]|uniref:monooxygenase 2-like n=1 Tax=Papaver somniferum TaxID=3469 RepID=UPI000E6FD539|nr:monooxygenase 2-like [Papaver somniferum]
MCDSYLEGHGLEHAPLQLIDTGRRFGVVPITDKEIYWFFLLSSTSQTSYCDLSTGDPKVIQENVLQRVANFPQIVHDVIRCSDMTTLTWAPMKFRYPWDIIIGRVSRGTVTVAGDALHPMTPDLAQGGCAVLEDAVILGRHIGNSYIRNGRKLCNKNLETEIEMYVKERRWRVASLVSASYFSGWVEQGGSGEAGWFVSEFHDYDDGHCRSLNLGL